MSSARPTALQRPGYGDKGRDGHKDRRTEVQTNSFIINSPTKYSVFYQYIIEFRRAITEDPKDKPTEGGSKVTKRAPIKGSRSDTKRLKRIILAELQRVHRDDWFHNIGVAFDGGETLYTTKKISSKQDKLFEMVEVFEDQDTRGAPNTYHVDIREHPSNPEIHLDELKTLMEGEEFDWDFFDKDGIKALNAIVHHYPALRYTQFGESIFDTKDHRPLGGGVTLVRGMFESIRPGEGQAKGSLFLNTNITYTTCYEPVELSAFIQKFLNLQSLPSRFDRSQIERINRAIKNLKVKPLHRPDSQAKYSVCGLWPKNASEVTFMNNETGQEESIETYFQRKYNMRLKHLHLVEMMGKRADKIPIEVCGIVEGQRYRASQLNGEQRANMIRHTSNPPREMKKLISDGIRNMLSVNSDPVLHAFGMTISTELAVVPGRVLNLPNIQYHPSTQNANVRPKPDDGGWNLRDVKFAKAGEDLRDWCVVSLLPEQALPPRVIEDFVNELVRTSSAQGMYIPERRPPVIVQRGGYTAESVRNTLTRIASDAKHKLGAAPQLIVFIIEDDSGRNRDLNTIQYNAIKELFDTKFGILTQCIKMPHVRKKMKQYCANVALKMNLKLNGTNSSLNLTLMRKEPVLILGADVTHPPPGATEWPSIAAVVGSIDADAARYVERHVPQYREQTTGEKKGRARETILTMDQMLYDILKDYRERNNLLPKKIIMFRDGLSESQFESCALADELPGMRAACKKMRADYEPPITYIVVGKRHHTRFYPMKQEDTDRKGNCKPGLLVERTITHPYLFDFFLQSHSSLQGTSRPTHYHVLLDENHIPVDELQDFTYKLCFNFQRSTRAVSIPAPTYYAHLVAKRARSHVDVRTGRLNKVEDYLARRYPMYYV
ncbi:4980_t:CDS:2 [Paraglomus occultum]|uniref:4980_t:CDS:1 n=1 Tax=Paraglomus occultum TaxID=144539 RepID=A0A9N9G973_9GLOM|nr:4980_t:CDS:2 [Paraglomus occultum]